ncbi:MAG: glycine oxidase ThiO [Dehalococcoidia bacterium]|nr:glycine oxidase ThiO [Dehalococcoidia bacterium]
MLEKSADVVIIGGGVIGCSIAYQLAKQQVRVVVLERTRFAAGASGATAGVISPLWHVDPDIEPMWRLGMRSLELFPSLASELSEAGVDPEFRQAGVFKLAFTDKEAEELQRNLVWQSKLGLGVAWLDQAEALQREPEASTAVLGGIFSPKEGHVRGRRLVDSLVQVASRLGAQFHQGVEVLNFRKEGNRVSGVVTSWGSVNAPQVVLAAGPSSGLPARWLQQQGAPEIPVRPVKGERILLRKPGFLPRSPVRNSEAYVVPRMDGDVLVAATRVESRFDEVVTAAGVSHLIAAAVLSFPSLAHAEFVSGRAGVRPATPDGMPVLGPVPDVEGLSIAAGHDSVGIMLSPATAEMMAQFLLDGNAASLEPFSISRF